MKKLTTEDLFIIGLNNLKIEKESEFLEFMCPKFNNRWYNRWMTKHFPNCRKLSKYQGLGSICWSRLVSK